MRIITLNKVWNISGFILFLMFFFFQDFYAQTSGLIFDPAGLGQIVLDPNGDGYTSESPSGFMSNDETESEIPYVAFPSAGGSEPDSDLHPGPSCSFTDLVKSDTDNTVYTYLDASDNLMFRFRLGGAASNSKGYSILIDTDQKFGFSGANADPNAISGNPGFEIEIVLGTNFGVGLYDIDGTISPTEIGNATVDRPYNDFAQKSIANSDVCGDDDYFYDFYIPFAHITAAFPGVTTSTPIRMVGATGINPGTTIEDNLSDIGGIDDNGGIDDDLFEELIDIFPPTPPIDINNGLPKRANCPSITGSLAVGTTFISGTSTEVDGATITVYRDGVAEATTTTVSGGVWTLSGLAPFIANQVFTATTLVTEAVAIATGTNEKSESYDTCNATTVGASCSPPISTSTTFTISSKGFCGDVGSAISGAQIRIYQNGILLTAGSGSSNFAGGNVFANADGSWIWKCNTNTNCSGGPNCGFPTGDTIEITQQEVGSCESEAFEYCSGGGTSATPVFSPATVVDTDTIISGTATPDAFITLYIDDVEQASTTAIGGNWSFTIVSLPNGTINEGESIRVRSIESGLCPTNEIVVVGGKSATPIIQGKYCAPVGGAITSVSGISSEVGATIDLYTSSTSPVTIGTSVGSTTVAINGSWTITGISANEGYFMAVTATNVGDTQSNLSNEVQVLSQTTASVTINTTPLQEGDSSVSGTTSAPDGSTVFLYIDGFIIDGFTGTASGGLWTINGLDTANAGYDVLFASGVVGVTVQEGILCASSLMTGPTIGCKLPVNQMFSATSTTVVCAGQTIDFSISGTENLIIYELIDQAGNGIGPAALGDGSALNLTTFGLAASVTSVSVKAQKIGGVTCQTVLTPAINVTVNVLPEVALTSNVLAICEGETSVDLAYSVTANGPPISYSIDFDDTANTNGFVDIVDNTDFTSPISISIPSGAVTGATYTGFFSIKNSNSIECESVPATFSIIINNASIGAVTTSNPTICGGANGNITLSGLEVSTTYNDLTYNDDGVAVSLGSFTTDAGGEFQITGLDAGSYANIIVVLNGCNSNAVEAVLSDPGAATISEGTHLNPASCITSNGAIVITGVVMGNYDVNFSFNGSPQPTQNLSATPSGISIAGLGEGEYTNISITNSSSCQSNTISGPITLMNPSNPAIILGTSPIISLGTTVADLPYTTITNSPDQYIVDYDTTAEGVGFVDITTPTSLPLSPVILAVPSGAPVDTYNGTIMVINSTTGCVSEVMPFTVTITPGGCTSPSAPVVTFSPDTYCVGNTIIPPTTSGTALQWYEDAGLTMPISTANAAMPTALELGFATTNSGTITRYVTQTIDCESTAAVIVLTVNPVPDLSTTAVPAICVGAVFDLSTISVTDGNSTGAILTYHSGTPATAGNVLASTTVNPTITTTYYILATTGSGCTDELPVSVTVNESPIVIANTTTTEVCAGESVTLTGGGATSYIWDNGVTNGISFVPTTTATYTVTGTDINGCENTAQIIITVNELPSAVTIIGMDPVCSGESAVFTIIGNAGDIVTYTTSFNSNTAIIGVDGSVDIIINEVTLATTLNVTNVNNPVTGCDLPLNGVSETINIIPFEDNDNDGIGDCMDPDPLDPCIPNICDTDNDGIPDNEEMQDDDDDGVLDSEEPNNSDPNVEDGLEIYNIVTPNGDGDHDVLIIRNIQKFPDNQLQIFNRWGVLVYETKGYGINGRFFKGESEGRATISRDRQLPVGTYFYILTYQTEAGETKKRSDYLYINR